VKPAQKEILRQPMHMPFRPLTAVLLLLAALAASAAETTAPDEFVITHHQVEVGGRTLHYTVRAGMLPIYANDTGTLMARMFIVACVADPKRGEPARPLTFVWNGGPGSASAELNLVGLGPLGLKTPPTYPEWQADPPSEIVERPETWLATSDLVFVDPIGTGYSRATSLEYRDILYTTRGDIEAVAEMIRVYRTRFDAWDAPLFIAGESYGTTRAMGVAEALERRRTGIAGVILISGEYEAGQEVSPALQAALQIPMFTEAAQYHRRLPAELQALPLHDALRAAEDWARQVYAPALESPDQLAPAARAEVIEGLTRYSGVAAKYIDEKSLKLDKNTFADRLLDDEDRELGRYDLRMTLPRRDLKQMWIPIRDPSLVPLLDLMQGTFPPAIRYFRDTLGYRSDLLYHGPFGEEFHPAPLVDVTHGASGDLGGIFTDWMTMMWNREAQSGPAKADQPSAPERPPLERAMERNPRLRVWNIRGWYDSSCAALYEAVKQTREPLRQRVISSCYPGGHMLYTDVAVRQALQRDFARFVSDATAARAK